ncbi:Crp/Fnr family transcriptional regulator [Hwangdonia lutea]|uniref:Crp/Fnr family transcriptional regulator n=1 Tax=Hwangdonia lutea TaxID=3075823 RepID=A0AA97EML1_9FLAO|nr:Crp/Fnr family transcriptional regulator [Hwangdonia sp. SCSIO 19198]WOD43716.1 Crp/Fnr family transcriptional regulator [Hwangdonia sp. SCSIO 19198]
MIPLKILNNYKALKKTYTKNSIVFNEGETARFYYQIKKGDIKMYNITEDGKEFVQGYFSNGNSFGEPPLFGNYKYPATAFCVSDCVIYKIPKATFFDLLKTHPDIHLTFTKLLCKRMVYKAKIMKELSVYPPEHRILTLLNHFKESSSPEEIYEVKLTRQQISELTGLRVETVIRAIKHLEKSNKLYIKERKVYI